MESVATPGDDAVWFRIDERASNATVRRAAMALAEQLAFSANRAAEVGIVATELTTNISRHAGGGSIAVRRLPGAGVGLVAVDQGPGMTDMASLAFDGQSTGGSLGIGIGAVHRLSTTVDAHTVPGRGTVTVASVWADNVIRGDSDVALLTRPMTNEVVCGDTCLSGRGPGRLVVAVADGLGHGPLAASASREATRVMAEHPDLGPAATLTLVHERLRHTRGAAVAIAEVSFDDHSVTFAGIGNIAGWIVQIDGRKGMVSRPGIIGHNARSIREERYEIPTDAMVVLHSDGLSNKWNIADYPGLMVRSPMVVAAVLLRDAGVRHDDASIAVARMPR